MKKLTALLLMLCLLAAFSAALGEDYTGTWYMKAGRVEAGKLELDADGSGLLDASESMNEMAGVTWETTENGVKLVIDGETRMFSFDGETLSSEDFPFDFGREPGAITMAQVEKYKETGELPAGITEEDIRAITLEFLAAQQGSEGSETSGETADNGSDAQPVTEDAPMQVSVLSENMELIKNAYSGKMQAYYFAEIQNNTESAFFVNRGQFTLVDGDGNVLEEVKYFQSSGSGYLEPGESSFVSFRADVPEGAGENLGYRVSFEPEVNDWYSKDRTVTVTGAELGTDRYDQPVVRVGVTNNLNENLKELRVVAAMKDAEGRVIWVRTGYLNAELTPGSSVVVLINMDEDIRTFFTENGITPASVEAFAYEEMRD